MKLGLALFFSISSVAHAEERIIASFNSKPSSYLQYDSGSTHLREPIQCELEFVLPEGKDSKEIEVRSTIKREYFWIVMSFPLNAVAGNSQIWGAFKLRDYKELGCTNYAKTADMGCDQDVKYSYVNNLDGSSKIHWGPFYQTGSLDFENERTIEFNADLSPRVMDDRYEAIGFNVTRQHCEF